MIVRARMLAIVFACTAAVASACSNAPEGTVCSCTSSEKFNGTTCVPADEFVAPDDCTDDGTPVCGCDGEGYTGECSAFAVGVQVRNTGTCEAGGGGGGGGW